MYGNKLRVAWLQTLSFEIIYYCLTIRTFIDHLVMMHSG